MTKWRSGINFFEYVQIGYKRIEQIWQPANSNVELDTLKVNKDFPASAISVPEDWNVSFGDVLNWSNRRPTEAYFVLEDRTLLKNPDPSGSGYLTIPFNVTSKWILSS
jgi:hypothetical protein